MFLFNIVSNYKYTSILQVNALLEGFGKDTGISPEEAVSRFHTMCDKNEDLKEFFEVSRKQLFLKAYIYFIILQWFQIINY